MSSCVVEREGHCKKYCWHVWRVVMVDVTHWVCHSPRQLIPPGSTLFRLQGAQQGHCPKWALHFAHFPGQNHSGSRVFRRGTDADGLCILCLSLVQEAQATACLVSAWFQVGGASYSPPRSLPLGFQGAPQEHIPGVPCVSFGELISGCDTLGRFQPSRIPGRCD